MDSGHRIFIERLLIATALVLLLLVLWSLRGLLILAFGAIVIAVLIRALADPLKRFGLGDRGSALVAVLAMAALVAAVAWLFGSRIGSQFALLDDAAPAAWRNLEAHIGNLPFGNELLDSLARLGRVNSDMLDRLGSLLLLVTTVATNLIVVLFGAIFLAMQPRLYRKGLLMLIPRSRRGVAAQALDDSGRALKLWLVGQLISMAIVGVLTSIGLWLAGVPSPLALGILAGLVDIVPYVGPVIAAIPGLLLALLLGPEAALWALLVYVVVQQIEGNLVLPLVQRRMVTLPPALTIFAILAGGLLFGVMGVLLAAPLLVVIYVLVKRLYVRGALNTDTPIPGDNGGDS